MTAYYYQPKFEKHLANKSVNLVTPTIDTLKVGLIASGTLAARGTSEGYEFVSDLLANNGSALTEVSTSGTGYTRQNLASVTYTVSGLVVTLSAANPSWPAATFSTVYGFCWDETASSATDATRPLICIWDFGGTQPVTAGTFTLTIAGTGIVTWTAAA